MQTSTINAELNIDEKSSLIGQSLSYGFLQLCFIYVLFVTSSMWFYPNTTENNAAFVWGGQTLYRSILLVMALCIAVFHRHAIAFLLQYKLLTALILVHFASIATSIEPVESLQFSIRLFLLVTFFGIVAMIIEPEKLLKILIGFFFVAGIANLFYVLALPQYGLMSGIHEGAWRGLFSHKNQFGYFCAYGLVLSYILLPRSLLIYGGMGLLYLVLLGKSQSGGAIACAAAGLIISSAMLYTPRIHWNVKAILLFIAILLATALIPFYGTLTNWILELLNKDPTLTNRTLIWELYLAEWSKSPVLGLGANAYLFNDALMTRIESALRVPGNPGNTSPHNGFIAIMVQTGVIGVIIYSLICAKIIISGIMGALRAAPAWCKVLTLFTVLHLMRGLGETGGSIKLTLYFALIVMAYVYFTKRHECDQVKEN